MQECNTTGCKNKAKYLMIKNKVTVRYCLECIQYIKERERAKDINV
jgi:hypothetical protein